MVLKKEETIAIIIDVQERLMTAMFEKEQLEHNLIKLVKGLKILDIPCIYTQQYTKGLGMTVPSIRLENNPSDFTYIEKITFSCMGSEEFQKRLEKSGCKNIVIAGMETHICVLQTVRDLLLDNFNVILVQDCIASRKLLDKEIGMKRMVQEGAYLGTYESVLFELMNTANHSQFKVISTLIK